MRDEYSPLAMERFEERSGARGSTAPVDAMPRYDAVAISLHWAVAAAVICAFPLGVYVADLPHSPLRLELVAYHRWLGVTILGLACVRLAWRLARRPPALPASVPNWQRRAAAIAHGALYALVLAVPLSGWASSSASGEPVVYLGLWPLPDLVPRDETAASALKVVHRGLNFALLGVVIVHVAAAVKHQFVDRDGLLGRMLPARVHFGSSGSAGTERR
jgi:cytochrome b561